MKMDSRKSSVETRMLERRVSNNRGDLNGDQRMNYFLSWFQSWSDLQKSDFVHVLFKNMNGEAAQEKVNGDVNGVKKPPSLFECQVKLFNDWFSGWSDDQKNYLVLRLQAIDADFFSKYETFEAKDQEGDAKDYFEPGVPAELVRKSSRSILGPNAATFNAFNNLQNPPASLKSFKDEVTGDESESEKAIEEAFQKLSASEEPLESIAE